MRILILVLCVCLSQATIFDYFKQFFKGFQGLDNRKVLKDFTDCGTRYEKGGLIPVEKRNKLTGKLETKLQQEETYAECMWDCEWRKNPFYKRTLQAQIKRFAEYKKLTKAKLISTFLPKYMVERIEKYMIPFFDYEIPDEIDLYITMPMVPKNFLCLSDCWIHPRAWECRNAVEEKRGQNIEYFEQIFYLCYAYLNSYTYKANDGSSTNDPTLEKQKQSFVARNYLESAVEICLLSNLKDPITGKNYLLDENDQTCGTLFDDFNMGPGANDPRGGVVPDPKDPTDPNNALFECKNDCVLGEVVYEDPSCLNDCWIPSCLSDLMADLTKNGGVCAGSFGAVEEGWTQSATSCVVNDDFKIWNGLCSQETERKLLENECFFSLITLSSEIQKTIEYTVRSMCSYDVYREIYETCLSLTGNFVEDATTTPPRVITGAFEIKQCDSDQFSTESKFKLNIEDSRNTVRNFDQDCKCGTERTTNRIVGGTEVPKDKYPWVVSLVDNNGLLFCAGTLVSSRHVISAASCVYNRLASEFWVTLGEHNLTTPSEGGLAELYVPVEKFTNHPDYNIQLHNDITVIELDEDVNLSIYTPACLPKATDMYTFDGKLALNYGWGLTDTDSYYGSDVLREVAMKVVSKEACSYAMPTIVHDGTLCAGGVRGKGNCAGDHGGPLTYENGDQHVLIGGVSFTPPSSPSPDENDNNVRYGYEDGYPVCGEEGYFDVFSRITYFRTWIDQQIAGGAFCSDGGADVGTIKELKVQLGYGVDCTSAAAKPEPPELDTVTMSGSSATGLNALTGFTKGHNIDGSDGRTPLINDDYKTWLMIADSTGVIGCSEYLMFSPTPKTCQKLNVEQRTCSAPSSSLTYLPSGDTETGISKSCQTLTEEKGEKCTSQFTCASDPCTLENTCQQSTCKQTQTCDAPGGNNRYICAEEPSDSAFTCQLQTEDKQICDEQSNSCNDLSAGKYLCTSSGRKKEREEIIKERKQKRNKNKRGKNTKKSKAKKNKSKAKKNKSNAKKNKSKAKKNKSKTEENKSKMNRNNTRLEGASIYPVDTLFTEADRPTSAHHPWMCSLRTRGFRGRHRCGLTLLSGPTEDSPEDPWVIVGAAHCNYICKDWVTGDPLETCCCRPRDNLGSCKDSPFCLADFRPVFALAESKDLVVVCGEFVTDVQNLEQSTEPEQVFQIHKIVNHPDYQPNRDGIGNGGPIDGNDIAVYHVFAMDTDFVLGKKVENKDGKEIDSKSFIWPICLPKNDDEFDGMKDGFVTGWLDTPPVSQQNRRLLGKVSDSVDGVSYNYLPRSSRMVLSPKCEDPLWQRNAGVETFYPPGTACFEDPSHASCIDFGSSGSGVVRKWKKRPDKLEVWAPLSTELKDIYQYSFAGPLSMSKGCDEAFETLSKDPNLPLKEFVYRGSNKAVATDASCFMDWIATEYNLKLEKPYKKKDTCFTSSGNKDDINRQDAVCSTSTMKCDNEGDNTGKACTTEAATCDFTYEDPETGEKWDRCRLYADEGIAKNVFTCYVNREATENINGAPVTKNVRVPAACANNCRGVDPNSIIGGGVAAVALGGLAAQGFVGPVAGAAGLMGVGGLGAMGFQMMMADSDCNPPLCRARSGQCCRSQTTRGRIRCPDSCNRRTGEPFFSEEPFFSGAPFF